MSYTADDLANIRKAIASGSLEVQFGDRRRRYRSLAELREAERHIQTELSGDGGPRRVMAVRTGTRKAIG